MDTLTTTGLGNTFASLAAVSAIYFFVIFLAFVLTYIVSSYMLMATGRKAGVQEDWQPYIPFAKEYYFTRIVREPAWKMVFLGSFSIVITLLIIAISTLFGRASLTMAIILLLAYFGASIYFNITMYFKFYKSFGYHQILSITRYIPLFLLANFVIGVIIATDRSVVYKGKSLYGAQSAAPGSPAKSATAVGLSGMYQDTTFDMSNGEEIVFGRDPETCNVIFDQFSANVSRKHCGIRFNHETDSFVVIDYSKNGTFYKDGRKIANGDMPTNVPRGTELYMGNKENTFLLK